MASVSAASRRFSNLLPLAQPLPQSGPNPYSHQGRSVEHDESYDVIVCGAGPAGLLLTLELARYGLSDDRLLCIDAAPPGKVGHADGLHPRALEILGSLGLTDPIMREGAPVYQITEWGTSAETGNLERISSFRPGLQKMPRYAQTINLAQGRLERILIDDLSNYSERGVHHGQKLVGVKVDENGSSDYPLTVEIESEGKTRSVKGKYLVGADGAHSSVRAAFPHVVMDGDSSDHVWAVLDFIMETDFPDARKLASIKAEQGMAIMIPRERLEGGSYLTRIYVFMRGDQDPKEDLTDEDIGKSRAAGSSTSQSPMTLDDALAKIGRIFHPFTVRVKDGTEVEWCSSYQIGQRLASQFIIKDAQGMPRIYLVGDAAHTHSPKVAQGMNVALADAHDLAWKLAHVVQGVCRAPRDLLSTYEIDRRENARNLIDFDKRWYGARFKRALEQTHDETVARNLMRREAGTFIAGINVEYENGFLVDDSPPNPPPAKGDILGGALQAGRVLQNIRVTRLADSKQGHNICEDLPAGGRFKIVVLTGEDLLNREGESANTLRNLIKETIPKFMLGLLQILIVCPMDDTSLAFSDLDQHVKEQAEFRFYCADAAAYAVYGVDPSRGAMTVIRPDGFIGTVAGLGSDGVERVDRYLQRCLQDVHHGNPS